MNNPHSFLGSSQAAPGCSPGNLPGRKKATGAFHQSARSAFTLVELMVVIGIIGLLTAISVPIVMQSLAKTRNAAIKAEIDMLHMAIMNYKNEYGSFPPCQPGISGLDVKHLQRIFPRISAASAGQQLVVSALGTDGTISDPTCRNSISLLAPNTALVFWLEGYTSNPLSPLIPSSERKRMFEFDQSRKQSSSGNFTGIYHPPGKPESPFLYIDSNNYPGSIAVPGFNPNTFQILCAGRDGEWGTPDDLSNFWPGTRGE